MRTRAPAVAGSFYPADSERLRSAIDEAFSHRLGPGDTPPESAGAVRGIICPHAGYMYSGPVACHSLRAISGGAYETFIIVGPDHRGVGRRLAVARDCSWETPLGSVEVDTKAADELTRGSEVEADNLSHEGEHSIEVQIPMLQHTFSGFSILPISMADQSAEAAVHLGNAVASVSRTRRTMVIGSSDLTHYEPNRRAHEQDAALLEPVLKLDVRGFYRVLAERRVTACGYGAVAAVMVAAKLLGASGGRLLKYATSGDVAGGTDSVVGYGAVAFA